MPSVAQRLAALPSDQRREIIAGLTEEQAEELLYDWRGFNARPEQIMPEGDWAIWLVLAGRGWGKSRTGAEAVREEVETGRSSRIGLIAETAADARDVMVAELLRCFPKATRPTYIASRRRIEFHNGAVAFTYNATEPDQLRGPQHDFLWHDELAKWRYARETWDQAQFGLRIGRNPRQIVTTTPRPIELVRAIVTGQEGRVHVTRGKTFDNAANLAPAYLDRMRLRYVGTRMGRQELDAEILGDMPGALWSMTTLDTYRLREEPPLKRIVVAVDPAVTATEDSDWHGIVVAGLAEDKRGVLVEDASVRGGPLDWARRAVALYRSRAADAIVVEVNQGGDMVAHTLRTVDPGVNIREVTATRGKHVRAEPIAALYEQGRIVHVGGFPELETQLTQITPDGYQGDGSPDRADALVWAMTELFGEMVDHRPKFSLPPPRPAVGGNLGWLAR